MYLGEPPVDRHGLAVRAGRHVAAGQHAGKDIRRGLELQAQDVGEPAFAGFDDGAGVMCDEPAQHGVGVLGVAQVPGAVEGVQARHGQARGVADVVQPGGGFQETGVRTENRGQAACLRGDALDVRPAAREASSRSARASCCAHEASVFMQPRLDSWRRTFTDVAYRLKTSCYIHQIPSLAMHGVRGCRAAAQTLAEGRAGLSSGTSRVRNLRRLVSAHRSSLARAPLSALGADPALRNPDWEEPSRCRMTG